MSPKKKQEPAADETPEQTAEREEADRRAEDQDVALETAFVEGTLPEEDRRLPEVVIPEEPIPLPSPPPPRPISVPEAPVSEAPAPLVEPFVVCGHDGLPVKKV